MAFHRFPRASRLLATSLAVVLGCLCATAFCAEPPDFRRDIQPILANHCLSCHGPDEETRKGGLRLDLRASAVSVLESGEAAIVPSHPETSGLLSRIESDDDNEIMPPPSAKKPLSARQKQLLREWIAAGAPYAEHWAFLPPKRPSLPEVKQQAWSQNPVDRFILAKLEQSGLAPSPAAEKSQWLRRVTLDLTGLPPTLQDQAAFLGDSSPTAYETVVDRLLQSPAHAERMAMIWLDAARYADTNGYNNDETRTMWPWRDWIINAFARNLPYDQFLTEQLAGDLLPDATIPQRVATGFNRNHVLTTEGGVIEEEYHVEYVADRVHTTATVFLALSMQCARCHDHKYDPITQKEYYQFSAFFGNVPDKVVNYNKDRMAAPLLKVPSPEQEAALAALKSRQTELNKLLAERGTAAHEAARDWSAALTPEQISQIGPAGLLARFQFDEAEGPVLANAIAGGESATINGNAARTAGKFGQALVLDGKAHASAASVGDFEADQPFSLSAWIYPTAKGPLTVLSRMDEANAFRGYDLILEDGRLASHIVHHWPDKGFKIITKEPLALSAWHHVALTYNGTRQASGATIYVDGEVRPVEVTTGNMVSGTLKTDKPFHIGLRGASAPFQGQLDDVQIYSTKLSADDVRLLDAGQTPTELREILALAPEARTEAQQELVLQYFLTQVDVPSREWRAELATIPAKLEEIDKAIPATMVMQEQVERRPTFVLKRGQYDQREAEVRANVPAILSPLQDAENATRLTLAKWLTRPEHPLTARVAVNRLWEKMFGSGLVETSEDFGIQGALPSHPELLDWLAVELVENGWDQRQILKLLALSATYRQSSKLTPQAQEVDPRNRLLSHAPRYRLAGEAVRDQALAVSGLLVAKVGGPSVRPYQPDGLWEDVSVERRDKYVPDTGDGLYRRSMYTFWKRTCPPPGMSTFDAPDRETCTVRRARTNTPLQALILWNDPTFVEASRKLAERVLSENDDAARLDLGWRIVLCRPPTETETVAFSGVLATARKHFAETPDAAAQLLTVGKSAFDTKLPTAELASWTVVMNMLLNLDEAISKP